MYTVRGLSIRRFFKDVDQGFFGEYAPKNDDKRHLDTQLVATNQYFHPIEVAEVFEKIAQKGSMEAFSTTCTVTIHLQDPNT